MSSHFKLSMKVATTLSLVVIAISIAFHVYEQHMERQKMIEKA
jgi:hypothetical protein